MKNFEYFLFLFCILFSMNVLAQEESCIEKATTKSVDQLIKDINSLSPNSVEQRLGLIKCFETKKEYFKQTELSDVRKRIVLESFNNQFEDILSKEQTRIIKNNSFLFCIIYNFY